MLFVDAGNNRVGVGTGAPGYLLDVLETNTGGVSDFRLRNAASTNAASGVRNIIQVANGNVGDPRLVLSIEGIQEYAIGIDNSDSDILKFNNGSDPSTSTNYLSLGAGAGGVVVNDGSDAAIDFRVESDAHTDKIFVDASANNAYFSGQAQAEGPFIIGTKTTSGGMSVLKSFQVSHVGTGPTSFTIQIATASIGEYFAQIRIVGVAPFAASGYFSQLYELTGYGGTTTNITTITNTRSGAGTNLTFSNATQTASYTQLPVSSTTTSYRFTVIATFYSTAAATGAISIA